MSEIEKTEVALKQKDDVDKKILLKELKKRVMTQTMKNAYMLKHLIESDVEVREMYEFIIPKLKQYVMQQHSICQQKERYLHRLNNSLTTVRTNMRDEYTFLQKPRKPRPVKPKAIVPQPEPLVDLFEEDRLVDESTKKGDSTL